MITFYTTHCPKCSVLKEKLDAANIQYSEIDDIETMKEKGIDFVPVLQVDDILMNFTEAVDWIKDRSGAN